MRERFQKIGGWVVWVSGFATGVQTLVYAVSAGGAVIIAAFAFLFKGTPFSFRAALFVGIFLILFAAINHLIGLFLARRKGQTAPVQASLEEDSSEIEDLRTRLEEVEQENNRLRREAIEDDQGVAHFRAGAVAETLTPARANQIEAEKQELRTEIERLTAENERLGYWDNRQMLHAALKDFYGDSFELQNEDYYEDDEVEQWESRTSQLIEEALDQEWVDRFLTNDDRLSHTAASASPRLAWLQYRRAQLDILIQVVNSLSPLEIRPDFDGRKWVGSEQFRFKQ